MKAHLYPEELYPDYAIYPDKTLGGMSIGVPVVVTKKLYEEYLRVHADLEALNQKLDKLYNRRTRAKREGKKKRS